MFERFIKLFYNVHKNIYCSQLERSFGFNYAEVNFNA